MFNKIIIDGIVSGDPITKISDNGNKYTRFVLQSETPVYDPADDTMTYVPIVMPCIAFSKSKYIQKAEIKNGTRVAISGRIIQQVVIEGNRKTTVDIIHVIDIDILSSSKNKDKWRSPLWKNHV